MLHFSLGNAYVLIEDLESAVKEFKRSAELDKKEAKYSIEYGRLLKVSCGICVSCGAAM